MIEKTRFHFATHDGTDIDDLGFVSLHGDKEAIAFGMSVIRKIVGEGGPADSSGHMMRITDGQRIVFSIPYDFDAVPNSQKN